MGLDLINENHLLYKYCPDVPHMVFLQNKAIKLDRISMRDVIIEIATIISSHHNGLHCLIM